MLLHNTQRCMRIHQCNLLTYTLSQTKNDHDVTERAQEYTLQDASFMRQSWCSFLKA